MFQNNNTLHNKFSEIIEHSKIIGVGQWQNQFFEKVNTSKRGKRDAFIHFTLKISYEIKPIFTFE